MGRLCGGTYEILGIPAPLCLHGWVVGGFMGWVVVVVGWVVVLGGVLVRGGWWWDGWCLHEGVTGWWCFEWVVGWWGGWWCSGWCANEGCVKWICITHIWSPTLFPGGIFIFQGVLRKLNFLMKFLVLEKLVDLMKDLKYEDQSIFPR